MDKKTFTIGVLSLSAVVLLAANLVHLPTADAALVIKDNEYTAVTARVARGGEALYILDNKTGMMVALNYDTGKKGIVPIGQPRNITEAFNHGGAGGNNPGRGNR